MVKTVTLHRYYSNRKPKGHLTFYSVVKSTTNPFRGDYTGSAEYILPDNVTIGIDCLLGPDDEELIIREHWPSGLPQLFGFTRFFMPIPILNKYTTGV